MRKTAMLALALLLAALSGCAQSVYNAYRDVGSLLVVQALGIDAAPGGGVTLSCATGADASDSEPVRLRCSAASLDEAMRELESLAGAGSLFFAGTGAIVLGEAAAGDGALSALGALNALLDTVRSGAVVTAVTDIYLCYELQSTAASPMSLVPAWCVVTDTENYYVNSSTGAVSAA